MSLKKILFIIFLKITNFTATNASNFIRFVSVVQTFLKEICTECDHGPIQFNKQLSRQRKERIQVPNLFVLEEKCIKCISWEFLPLNEAHFYSLYSHHMSLLFLLGLSAQAKYDSGSSALKQNLSA